MVKILNLHKSNIILKMENEKIIDIIKKSGKALKSGEVAEAGGLDKKDVDKAIKKLVAEGKLHSPKRCYYDISK